MEKQKRAAMVSSYGDPFSSVNEEAKARFKYQNLLHDYQELLKETEAKKEKLVKAKQKKFKLRAEVKFLRRKYESFLKKTSGRTSYRLKRMPGTVAFLLVESSQPSKPSIRSQVSAKESSLIARDTSAPRTLSGIDLNQVSLPDEEEVQEFQVHWEPLKIDKLRKNSNECEALPNNPGPILLRDTGNGPRTSRAGKRKVTWQDQVALKGADPFAM